MSPPLEPELLLTHAGAVRSMARALLHDEHAAEDVVQETWLRAWIAPPRADGSLGGWLRRVAEGFALQRRRAEGRRARREREYAAVRPESVDPDQRSVVLRAVVEAVLALDEPYRETVLLRWFEGLPPRAIAERLNVRVATIDSRLQRAHDRLRAKLERELGDGTQRWRGLLALVLGAPREVVSLPTLAVPLAGVAVSLKLTSAALAVVVGVCVWIGWDHSEPQTAEPVGIAAATSTQRDLPALADGSHVATREVASEATSTVVPSTPRVDTTRSATLEPGPYSFALRIEVVDSGEFPLHGAELFLGPRSCSTVSFGLTGWDGVLEKEWRGFEPKFEGVLFVQLDVKQSSLRRVSLTSGTRSVLRFQMDPSTHEFRVAIRLEARPAPSTRDEFVIDAAGNGMFVDSTLARVLAKPRPAPTAEDDRVSAADSATAAEDSRVSASDASTGQFPALTERVLVGKHDQPLTAIPPAAPAEEPLPRATVRGVVGDEHGRPITDLVVAGRTPERWNTGVMCDADGAFVFQDVPPGRIEICVGGGDRALVREVLELAPGESRFLELRPTSRTKLRLALRDGRAQALTEWIVEARGLGVDGPLLAVGLTDESGSAVLGLDADVPVRILARPRGTKATAAVVVAPNARAQSDALVLEIPLQMRTGSITLIVEGLLSESVDVRAWRSDSGEGVYFDRDVVERGSRSEVVVEGRALLPGTWRVEMRTPGRAWTDVGVYDVPPGDRLDLGRIQLSAPASAVVGSTDARVANALVALRARVDGALVIWPEQEILFPSTLMALPNAPIEFLRRNVGETDRAATLPFPTTHWLQVGSSQSIDLPPSR